MNIEQHAKNADRSVQLMSIQFCRPRNIPLIKGEVISRLQFKQLEHTLATLEEMEEKTAKTQNQTQGANTSMPSLSAGSQQAPGSHQEQQEIIQQINLNLPIIRQQNEQIYLGATQILLTDSSIQQSQNQSLETMASTKDILEELKQLRTQNADLKEENADLKEENADLKKENADLKKENADLKERIKNLSIQNKKLKEKNEQQDSRIQKLQEQYASLSQRFQLLRNPNQILAVQTSQSKTSIEGVNTETQIKIGSQYEDPELIKQRNKLFKKVDTISSLYKDHHKFLRQFLKLLYKYIKALKSRVQVQIQPSNIMEMVYFTMYLRVKNRIKQDKMLKYTYFKTLIASHLDQRIYVIQDFKAQLNCCYLNQRHDDEVQTIMYWQKTHYYTQQREQFDREYNIEYCVQNYYKMYEMSFASNEKTKLRECLIGMLENKANYFVWTKSLHYMVLNIKSAHLNRDLNLRQFLTKLFNEKYEAQQKSLQQMQAFAQQFGGAREKK